MPVPVKVPIAHYRGDVLGVLIRLFDDAGKTIPSDLAGSTVLAQVRANPDSPDILTSFGVAVSGNEVTLTLTPTQTGALPKTSVYDVQVTWGADPAQVQTVVAGALTADPDVTR